MTPVSSTITRVRTRLLTLAALAALTGLAAAAPAMATQAAAHVARHHAARHAKPKRPTKRRTVVKKIRARKPKAAKPSKTASAPKRTVTRPVSATATPAQPIAAPSTTTTTPTLSTTAPLTATTASPAQPTIFSLTSVWNQPLADDAALDPQSSTYVSDLLSQVSSYGLWMNTYQYSTPVYTVPADQPTVSVKLDTSPSPQATALRASWQQQVPIPPNAKAAAGTDEHMVIYQPSTDRMWEFWKMTQQADGWHAQWGGSMDDVSTNPGYFTSPTPSNWGATATSLPLLGGLIRPSELAAGHIDHAIAMAIPNARAQYFTWPAQRTDGQVSSATAIPEGQRFRLDPTLDLGTIPMSPLVRMIAVAAQKYGMIVRDKSGSVTLYGEDTTAEGLPNPYYGSTGWFQGQYVNNLLKAFPWAHLEALQDTMSCCWQKP